jgi:hypothetical protein
LTYRLIEWSTDRPYILLSGAIGLLLLVSLVLLERKAIAPMMPVDLFRNHPFSAANLRAFSCMPPSPRHSLSADQFDRDASLFAHISRTRSSTVRCDHVPVIEVGRRTNRMARPTSAADLGPADCCLWVRIIGRTCSWWILLDDLFPGTRIRQAFSRFNKQEPR